MKLVLKSHKVTAYEYPKTNIALFSIIKNGYTRQCPDVYAILEEKRLVVIKGAVIRSERHQTIRSFNRRLDELKKEALK